MIIVIVGATATGKSDLAIKLAKRYNGEIISGDSVQVYKELSIGSAKISSQEMQGIPHYFIDYCHYDEKYNVKIFQEIGRKYIEDILSRKKTVIVCGGTGLYIKALVYDYVFHEENDNQEYIDYLSTLDNATLYRMLQEKDEKSCKDIHINNKKRIIRALVMAQNGETRTQRIAKQQHKMLYDAIIIGLDAPREILYEKINQRVDKMMKDGLLEEVTPLSVKGFELQSMQAIGYKEFKPYFEGEISLDAVVEKIKKNTRNLAKRQHTFFNNQFNMKYFNILEDYENQVIHYIEEKYHEQNK